MSGVATHIYGSIGYHLQEWFDTNKITAIAWENKSLDPPAIDGTKSWARVSFFPAETRQGSLGDEGLNEMSGIMLVNLFYPKGKGSGILNALADSLVSHFKRGTITAAVSGYTAKIKNAWRDSPLPDDRWFNIPVRVRYYQYVNNI